MRSLSMLTSQGGPELHDLRIFAHLRNARGPEESNKLRETYGWSRLRCCCADVHVPIVRNLLPNSDI